MKSARSFFVTSLAGYLVLAAVALLPGTASAQRTMATYTNPLNVRIADPFVLQEDGTYYLYGTTSYPRGGFEAFTSPDLVHWRHQGACYKRSRQSWGDMHFWAPEVMRKDNTYYLVYAALNRDCGRRNIGMATSQSPLGPFKDVKTPFFPDSYSFIDPHLFRDPASGSVYLYVTEENTTPSRILGVRLSPTLLEAETTLTPCLVPDQKWEDHWTEAPFVLEHKGLYYMMYSGSAFNEPSYAVGYAVASNPLGPWKKFEGNPILKRKGQVDGPGHNGVAASPDGKELFMVYHRHASPWSIQRELAIDRLQFVAQPNAPDRLEVKDAPSQTPQCLPSGAKGLALGCSDEFDSATLDFSRWMSIGEIASQWKIDKGALVITTDEGDAYCDHNDAHNIFLQYAPAGDFTITTKVSMDTLEAHEQAQLLVFDDFDNYIKLATVYSNAPKFEAACELDGKFDSFLEENTFGRDVYLRIMKHGQRFTFWVSGDGRSWNEVGMGYDYDRPARRVGIGACSPGCGTAREARFEFFDLKPAS